MLSAETFGYFSKDRHTVISPVSGGWLSSVVMAETEPPRLHGRGLGSQSTLEI
jgi:hypothetical protein